MSIQPNLVFILADQLRADSLPLYGETQISTPNIDRLARSGVMLSNALSTCPVCTPYRSMLLTGRYPTTTGHLINFIRTRHSEISLGDAFGKAGYETGWIGKWHLHTGSFPTIDGRDYVPEGRDRLGFNYWRGYNFHMTYFNGAINLDDWHCTNWRGYETEALGRYAVEFMNSHLEKPFCLFISPHQPHQTPHVSAPQQYYDRLPKELTLPANVPDQLRQAATQAYRHYLAMTLAVDDMVGAILDYLDENGRADDTLVIFTSDHGSQMGSNGIEPWLKKAPYNASVRVPFVMRWPGVLPSGHVCDTLTAPVDILPSLCGLCGVAAPRTVEGYDLSDVWQGRPNAFEQSYVLTMNYNNMRHFDYLVEGDEWRGVRSKQHAYTRWLDGRIELYDLQNDKDEMHNVAYDADSADLVMQHECELERLLALRQDAFLPARAYRDWFDEQRRVIRNAFGPLGNAEETPDWSLLPPE